MAIRMLLHTPDYENGRDEVGDVVVALCGARPVLGDLHELFGLMPYQQNCPACLEKRDLLKE